MLKRHHIAALLTLLLVATFSTAAPAAGLDPDTPMGQGTEDRGWVDATEPDPTSPVRYDVTTHADVSIEMRDGVNLDAGLYLPDLPDGPGPCILVATGYGWDTSHGATYHERLRDDVAARGFAVAQVSLRGTGDSEGEANLYNKFGEDGYDLVEWMADQPWCDGNVGMFGASLLGISQWLTAKEAPPSLKAIIPHIACGDCYEYLWYRGGMLPGPGRVARGEPEYTSAAAHRNYDEWWRERTTTADDHAAMADDDIAIMATGGWVDYISSGNVRAFEEFTAAGGDGMLIQGPWAHSRGEGEPVGPYDINTYQILWFDRHLRGEDTGVTDDGRALIYVYGPNRWRFEESWPIPDERRALLHLRAAESGTIDSLNDGSLTAAAPDDDEASVSYSYDPETGPFLPTRRGSGAGITDVDVQPWESQVLTWTTGELAAPTEITGTIEVEFFAAADTDDTDFVVQISDVAPDGSSTQVTSGYLNAPRADSRAEPDPLEPGEVRHYTVQAQPMAYVFDEGHRIRVSLAGGTETPPDVRRAQGPGHNPNEATVTIFQDAERPATVELPVIGTAVLPSELESKDECKDGGWRDFGFRNQGQCIRYVNTGRDSR